MRSSFDGFDDEPVMIDLIDADPAVFGGRAARATAEPDEEQAPNPRRPMPRWLIPGAGVLLGALLLASVAVWQPWERPPARPFTAQLVFDKAPAALESAFIGSEPSPGVDASGSITAGEFYAAPGATFQLDDPAHGTWAAFIARKDDTVGSTPDDTTVDPASGDTAVTLHGVSGVLHSTTPRQIDWSLDGQAYSAVAMGLTTDELLRFARAASVESGVAHIDDPAALGTMQPLGSWDTYYRVAGVLAAVRPNAFMFTVATGTNSVSYGPTPSTSVASTEAVGGDELAMTSFVLGGTKPAKVHGKAAATGDGTTFRSPELTVVAWVERGRLILVATPDSAAKTLALAATVRDATPAEWNAVVAVASASNASTG